MKRLTIIFLTLISGLLFTQCINQKNITKMKIFEKELVFPDISPKYEKLTSSELKYIMEKKELAVEKYPQELNLNPKAEVYIYTEFDKEKKIEYNYNDVLNTLEVSSYLKIEPDDNKDFEKSIYFMEVRTYSLDGKLIEKGLKLMSGSSFCMYLKRYDYDINGNLIYGYEHSDDFKQSLSDILKILERYNLLINFNNAIATGGNRSYLTTIEAVNSNYGKVWFIGIGLYNGIIDDASGEIIVHNTDKFLKEKYSQFSITNKTMSNYEWDIMIDKVK